MPKERVAAIETALKEKGKKADEEYECKVYEGAHHGLL